MVALRIACTYAYHVNVPMLILAVLEVKIVVLKELKSQVTSQNKLASHSIPKTRPLALHNNQRSCESNLVLCAYCSPMGQRVLHSGSWFAQ